MKKNTFLKTFWLLFLIPSLHYAQQDNEITGWAQEVLLTTLSIPYNETPDNIAKIRANYLPTAWDALNTFLADEIVKIHDAQLILHPRILTPAVMVNQGIYSGIQYWRVNQSIEIPELNLSLDFSLLIIAADNPPFLIQSINMVKHQY